VKRPPPGPHPPDAKPDSLPLLPPPQEKVDITFSVFESPHRGQTISGSFALTARICSKQ
jgi:hypothetical protein